jgi:hypothetical protein
MQGRSFKNGEVTQEISDPSRTYRLLGSDKYVSNEYKQLHVNFIEVLNINSKIINNKIHYSFKICLIRTIKFDVI